MIINSLLIKLKIYYYLFKSIKIKMMNLAYIKEYVINESLNGGGETLTPFFKLLKENPELIKEHDIIESIKSKRFNDKLIAQKYLDNIIQNVPQRKNINFNGLKEHKENVDPIVEDIHNILHGKDNIDLFIESYENVLSHLVREETEQIDEETVKLMEEIYHEEYSKVLTEEEEKFISEFSEFEDDKKKEFFYFLKTQKLSEMYETMNSSENSEKKIIKEAINKVKELPYSEENVIELYVL